MRSVQIPPGAIGKCGKNLLERRHHADTLAPKGKRPALVGGVAVTDVEPLQLLEGVFPGGAGPFRPACDGPVVEHREPIVDRAVHVELDDVGTQSERRLHGRNRVLEVLVLRRQHARRRAGLAREPLEREPLPQRAVGHEKRLTRQRLREPRRVVQVALVG